MAILAWNKYLELAPNGDMAETVKAQIEEMKTTHHRHGDGVHHGHHHAGRHHDHRSVTPARVSVPRRHQRAPGPAVQGRRRAVVSSDRNMKLLINKTTASGAYVIHVDGELDVYTAPRLKEALAEGMAEVTRRSWSTCSRSASWIPRRWACWWAACEVDSEHGELRLVIDDPHLAKIFRITGFDGMFSIYTSLARPPTASLRSSG